jgi:hypothetical protein
MRVEPEVLKRAAVLTLQQWGMEALRRLPEVGVGAAAFVLLHLLAASLYLFAVSDPWPGLTAFACGLLFVIWTTKPKTMRRTLFAAGWFYVALGVGGSLFLLFAAAVIDDGLFLVLGLAGLVASVVLGGFIPGSDAGSGLPRRIRCGSSRLQGYEEARRRANEILWQSYLEGEQ